MLNHNVLFSVSAWIKFSELKCWSRKLNTVSKCNMSWGTDCIFKEHFPHGLLTFCRSIKEQKYEKHQICQIYYSPTKQHHQQQSQTCSLTLEFHYTVLDLNVCLVQYFCVAMYLTNSDGSIQGRDEEQASDPHDVWGWTGSRYGGTSCWAQTVLWWAVFVTAQCSWHHTSLPMDTQRGFVHLDAISQQVKMLYLYVLDISV